MNESPAISPETLDGTMRTVSGVKFDLVNPQSTMVNILDIAMGLTHNSHFNGQSPCYFSIAQHSVMVLDALTSENPDADTDLKLMALLHDAAEAYTGDIIKPLKVLLPEFAEIERKIMVAIACKFQLPLTLLPEIKPFDLKVQNIEYEGFYNDGPIKYWTCTEAYRQFMARFNQLIDER